MNIKNVLYRMKIDIPDYINHEDIALRSSDPTSSIKINVGWRGRAGEANSIHSPKAHSAKINTALAVLFDIITEKTNIEALTGTDSVYVETDSNAIIIDNNEYRNVTKDDISEYDSLLALTAYVMGTKSPDFDEVQQAYNDVVDEYNALGEIRVETALKYCDSFFFTVNKGLNLSDLTSGGILERGEIITTESLNMYFRNEKFSLVDFRRPENHSTSLKYYDISKLSADKSKTTKSAASKKPIIDRCKDGEFILPYEWPEEERSLIPPLSFFDLFIPSEEFEDALTMMYHTATRILERMDMGLTGADAIGNDGMCYAFLGKPGTGKSTLAKALCAAFGMPFYPSTTTKFSEEDEYQGKTKLSHENSEDNKAAFKFCETSFLKGFQNGGLVVLEEFNLADPGMLMGAIGQAIEKPFVLEKDGYMPTVRHPLCFIAVTCNVGTQGSQMPSEALFSRTPHVFSIEDPEEDEFIKILQKQNSDVTESQVRLVFRVYTSVHNWLKIQNMPELSKVITLRHCLAALQEVAAGIKIKKACVRTLINPLKAYAPEIIDDVYDASIQNILD